MASNGTSPEYEFGHQFGSWTVVRKAPNKGTRRAWRCVCSCGNASDVLATNLRSGHSTKCKKCSLEESAAARIAANTKHGQCTGGRKTSEYSAASYHKRRFSAKNAGGNATALDIEMKFAFHGNRCIYCGSESSLEVEHRKPLSRGGSNHPANLAPACGFCNRSKGGKTEQEYREYMSAR